MIVSNYRYPYFSNILQPSGCTEFGEAQSLDGDWSVVVEARRLAWDSRVLARSCGRIDALWARNTGQLGALEEALARTLARMDEVGIELCDLRTGLHDFRLVHLAERSGFRLMDVMNTYVSRPPAEALQPVVTAGDCLIEMGPRLSLQEIEQVAMLAASSFRYSRLYQDSRIATAVADSFYRELLRTIIAADDSHIGIAFDGQKEIAGFYIGKIEPCVDSEQRVGCLWLIAVAPGHLGKGLGAALLKSFLAKMHQTCQFVEIGTQATNLAANRLYQAAGLQTAACVATFHRWQP